MSKTSNENQKNYATEILEVVARYIFIKRPPERIFTALNPVNNSVNLGTASDKVIADTAEI